MLNSDTSPVAIRYKDSLSHISNIRIILQVNIHIKDNSRLKGT